MSHLTNTLPTTHDLITARPELHGVGVSEAFEALVTA